MKPPRKIFPRLMWAALYRGVVYVREDRKHLDYILPVGKTIRVRVVEVREKRRDKRSQKLSAG